MQFSSVYANSTTEFNLATADLSGLEIRSAGDSALYYFYDTKSSRLITDFVLEERPRVATLCQVTLIKGAEGFSPRIRLWKKDKTKRSTVLEGEVTVTDVTKVIKASVDTDSCHETFWQLINFLGTFKGVVIPQDAFRFVAGDKARLIESLQLEDKDVVLSALQTALGGSLTEQDINLLANRKAELDHFEKLLTDSAFFDAERQLMATASGQPAKKESVWQHFFEKNPWIFGYGLSLISCEALDDKKLEQITTGASLFTGGGKRVDAVMRSRGYVSSLLFCEIKTHETPLLMADAYRKPDVYQPSSQLTGSVAQIQKTVEKAVRSIGQSISDIIDPDGTPTGIQISSTKPRQVIVVGSLEQLVEDTGINREKVSSFELYRNSIHDVEILTFDELLARAKFIIQDK
jgi:hypothetical protein